MGERCLSAREKPATNLHNKVMHSISKLPLIYPIQRWKAQSVTKNFVKYLSKR